MHPSPPQLLPTPGVGAGAKTNPVVVVSGATNDIDRTAATFKLCAAQYVQQLGSAGKLPVSVTIPDTGRYKKTKPLPFNEGSNATVIGHLMHVERAPDAPSRDVSDDDDLAAPPPAEYLGLQLENVVYFPRNSYLSSNTSGML